MRKFLLSQVCCAVFLACWAGCSNGSSGGSGAATHDAGPDSSASTEGAERQPCYPNGTCNSGLTCASEVCVRLPDASGTGGAAGSGTAGNGTVAGGSAGNGTATGGTTAVDGAGAGGVDDTMGGAPTSAAGAPDQVCRTPTNLHPPTGAKDVPTVFCPESGVDGGKTEYCTAGSQHCCEPADLMSKSACEAIGTACAAATIDWQCADPATDCQAGQVCCGHGTFVQSADVACANTATGFTGTHCAASCQGSEIQLCTSDGECNVETCTPFWVGANQVGACRPD